MRALKDPLDLSTTSKLGALVALDTGPARTYEESRRLFTERLGDETVVLLVTLLIDAARKDCGTARRCRPQPVTVNDRDYVIPVGHEIPESEPARGSLYVALSICEDEPGLIEAVTPKHAANAVGDKLTHTILRKAIFQISLAMLAP